MAHSGNQMQLADEISLDRQFQDFRKIFFDPCQHRRRFLIGGGHFSAHSDDPFVKAAEKFKLSKSGSEVVEDVELMTCATVGESCTDDGETRFLEGEIQPDIVRSTESSESQLPSPVSPDVVPEVDEVLLKKQWSEPSCNRKASLNRILRRTASCEEPPKSSWVKVVRQMSDSVDLRRLSSAYGSQDQSISTSGRNEEEDDEEQPVLVTPPSLRDAGPLYYGAIMRDDDDDDDDDDESTILLTVSGFQHPCPPISGLRMDFLTTELSDDSNAGNIPSMVTDWQLSDENEFESVYMPNAVTAAGGLKHDQSQTPSSEIHRPVQQPIMYQQAAQQPMTFPELYAVIAQLENTIMKELLLAHLQANCSPEFVHSVAESLFLSALDAAATGTFRFCFFGSIFISLMWFI